VDHLSTSTVPPTCSLNIIVIELPTLLKGPLSNLSPFSVAVARALEISILN
jgi:hypothetical protein